MFDIDGVYLSRNFSVVLPFFVQQWDARVYMRPNRQGNWEAQYSTKGRRKVETAVARRSVFEKSYNTSEIKRKIRLALQVTWSSPNIFWTG